MKRIILIFILIFTCLLITGCASTNNSTEGIEMGMIIMPDGSIIKGECSNFIRISSNWAIITIEGVKYAANDWRIVRWK